MVYLTLSLHSICLMDLASNYFANSDCLVLMGCYSLHQIVLETQSGSHQQRRDAASEPKHCIFNWIYLIGNQTQKSPIPLTGEMLNICPIIVSFFVVIYINDSNWKIRAKIQSSELTSGWCGDHFRRKRVSVHSRNCFLSPVLKKEV